MNGKVIMGSALLLLLAADAGADTSVTRSESTRVESESNAGGMGDPAQAGSRHSEFSRQETTTNNIPPAIGSTTTTSKTVERTWSGTVRRVDPSRAVVIVNGEQFAISGPYATELLQQPDRKVTIYGSLNEPSKTIEITRYELVN